MDCQGTIEGINHKTGETVELTFLMKDNKKDSALTGKCYDAQSKCKYEIEGTWLEEIRLKEVSTKKVEVLWHDLPMIPEAHLQYFYSRLAILLNYRS